MTVDVGAEALAFGQELQDLLDRVLPLPDGVAADDRQILVDTAPEPGRYQVRVAAQNSLVALSKNGAPISSLRIAYQCTADTPGSYLAVDRSDFELRELGNRTPIARLDFVRSAHTVPGCHWNIHAERGTATRLLALGNPSHSGEFSKLHFPVGGARMRPCLEDFLAFVLVEFGADRCDGADEVLCDGRERWRRRQIATLVRDAPDEAVRILEELGYTVAEPATGPREPNTAMLRAW